VSATTDYSACWASCLGDCAEGMSDEHLISECLFPSVDIFVQGYSWCKDGSAQETGKLIIWRVF